MFCSQCGNKLEENARFCPVCGKQVKRAATSSEKFGHNGRSEEDVGYNRAVNRNNYASGKAANNMGTTKEYQRCLPAFIIGLIGSIFGMFGGLCVTMCDWRTGGNAPFLLIFGGSVVGLIGACLCMSKAKTGSILELIGGVMIIICAYGITGADVMSVFAMVLLLIGGLIGIIDSFIVKHK